MRGPGDRSSWGKDPLSNPHGWDRGWEASTRPTTTWAGAHLWPPLPADTCLLRPTAPCPLQECSREARGLLWGGVERGWPTQLVISFIILL